MSLSSIPGTYTSSFSARTIETTRRFCCYTLESVHYFLKLHTLEAYFGCKDGHVCDKHLSCRSNTLRRIKSDEPLGTNRASQLAPSTDGRSGSRISSRAGRCRYDFRENYYPCNLVVILPPLAHRMRSSHCTDR
jgi:hypothetical protein